MGSGVTHEETPATGSVHHTQVETEMSEVSPELCGILYPGAWQLIMEVPQESWLEFRMRHVVR